VETARQVDRTQLRHQRVVVAELPRPEGLPGVGVQVDGGHDAVKVAWLSVRLPRIRKQKFHEQKHCEISYSVIIYLAPRGQL